MATTLGFFTQNELDAVVGYPRRRQRLVENNVLPPGEHIKTFGRDSIVFPEFGAAGLILERPSANDLPYLQEVRSATVRLYKTEAFAALKGAMYEALRVHRDWRLTDVVADLVENAGDALQAWREQVTKAEEDLAERGIQLRIDVGRIEDVTDRDYRIALADSGDIITCALNATRTRLAKGTWVTRDLVELGARKGEVVVPTVAPDIIKGVVEKHTQPDTDEAMWEEMFRNVDYQPVAVPYLRESVGTDASAGDLVRPKRRLQLRPNRALYANANTMARSQSSPRAR
jgi:hypothetical protein